MSKINLSKIERVETDLKKYEEIKFKINENAMGFIVAMKETNKKLIKKQMSSIGYSNVYLILYTKTKIFKNNSITDFTCFYDKELVREILDQLTESEKLKKMESKILIINELLLKIEGLRNTMREVVEDFNDSPEVEELLDSIESLSLIDEITIKKVEENLEKIKKIILKAA